MVRKEACDRVLQFMSGSLYDSRASKVNSDVNLRFGTYIPPYLPISPFLIAISQFQPTSISYSFSMAPHPGIDTDQIRDRCRRDLFNLLEGVGRRKQDDA